MTANLSLNLHYLPENLPLDNAVRIELVEGIPIFLASSQVQQRIQTLIYKQQYSTLTLDEDKELDRYEELDDYVSFVNRIIRNTLLDK
ncbi:MAG: hypothetical protein IGS23_19360 [Rivularia sp. T60_A2020_040]|nr:hypothetical protein [Rivularia sp. T60_A2020_040]